LCVGCGYISGNGSVHCSENPKAGTVKGKHTQEQWSRKKSFTRNQHLDGKTPAEVWMKRVFNAKKAMWYEDETGLLRGNYFPPE